MSLQNLFSQFFVGCLFYLLSSAGMAAEQVLFQQPPVPIDSLLFVNTSAQKGQFSVTQWFPNPSGSTDVPVRWNVGNFTGFFPRRKLASQRGVSATLVGSTAVQSEDDTVGILIDTKSAFAPGTNATSIATIVSGYGFPYNNRPKPFIQNGKMIVFSVDVQIPYMKRDEKAIPYISMNYYFADLAHGGGFWYSYSLYDAREASQEFLMMIGDIPMVKAVAGLTTGKHATVIKGSAPFQPKPWTGYKNFQFAVTAENLRNAVAELKARFPKLAGKFSDDPRDYIVGSFNFNPEINRGGGDAVMGLSFRNMRVVLQSESK